MSSTRIFLTSISIFTAVLIVAAGCVAPPPPGDVNADAGRAAAGHAGEESAAAQESADSPFGESLQIMKNATVTTGMDRYDVRNIHFNTGHGFGGGSTLVGYDQNTRLEIRKRFISKIRILDNIMLTEALSVSHKYDMIEDQDLKYIFRTEVVKTDGERIEFIVRINQISGELQEGGSFVLTGDELQSLRNIVFY